MYNMPRVIFCLVSLDVEINIHDIIVKGLVTALLKIYHGGF